MKNYMLFVNRMKWGEYSTVDNALHVIANLVQGGEPKENIDLYGPVKFDVKTETVTVTRAVLV